MIATESDSGKLVAGRPETRPDDSCKPACFQTRSVSPNTDQAIQSGSGSVLYNKMHVFFKKERRRKEKEKKEKKKKKKETESVAKSQIWQIRPGPILVARWP